MELVQVRDEKIVPDNLYYDTMTILVQLGLVPQGRQRDRVVIG